MGIRSLFDRKRHRRMTSRGGRRAEATRSRFETLEGRALLAALPGGTSYTETFDGIGAGLPAGWTVRTGATAAALGTSQTFTTTAIDWANTGGAFKNFASADGGTATDSATAQAASVDRALGKIGRASCRERV